MKVILSFFDYTGNWSKPWEENGYEVFKYDIKNGQDILNFDPSEWMANYYRGIMKYSVPEIGILAAVPCTDYALSGARHFKAKDIDGRTAKSQLLVEKTRQIIEWFQRSGTLVFWCVENPMSRIHTLNPWMGNPMQKFNPCDFALYDHEPENSRYNKQTWLWGNFKKMKPKRLEPIQKEFPGFTKLGGASEKVKEIRSITPMGFAYAFYEANRFENYAKNIQLSICTTTTS